MDYLGGALAFKGTLDIDDFNVNSQTMERRIREVSTVARQESVEMETMFNRAAQAFAGIVGIGAAKGFVKQMIQVRSEMQNTEASFKVFLGTASKAEQFFSDLQRYAYNNVFEFADLSKQAAQLLAFRNDAEDVIPILDKLSNIAAGANAPLAEFVSLYNKAKANNKLLSVDIQMWESRGVPVVYEIAQAYGKTEQEIRAMVSAGKIGFKELDMVVTNLTSRGGMFAGMMIEKMKTLGDSIGLLQDNITNMFNELGAKNQGVLKSGIDLANRAVENYDALGRALGALVVGYGTYRAAVVATSLARKNGTGIAILDNTVRAIQLNTLKAEAALSGQAAEATKRMTVASREHVAALQAELTSEEAATVMRKLRVTAIQGLLTAQQQEYLSNLNLTSSSAGYEAAAMSVLTAEQRLALSKMDLTTGSSAYRAVLEQEVAAKRANLDAMRQEVSAAAARREEYKQAAIQAQASVDAARYEVYWAQQSGDAARIAAAEKKLEGAEDNASVTRKAALAAQTDFLTKKKELEAAASKKNVAANAAESASEVADAASKNVNTVATNRLTIAIKALWTTIKANPLGWIISILGTVASLLLMFRRRTDESTDAVTEFENNVRKETSTLRMYFSILESVDRQSLSYKDAVQKVNAMCKQYNVTLLEENATVDQLRAKYDELTVAINKSAKARIQSSSIEMINREATETEDAALKKLQKQMRKARYTTEQTGGNGGYNTAVRANADNIRNLTEATWESVGVQAKEAAGKLKDLTGDAYEKAFQQVMDGILQRLKETSGASDAELRGIEKQLTNYVKTVTDAEIKAGKEIAQMNREMDTMFVDSGTAKETKIDYTTKSLQELDDLAKEARAEIETLNGKTVRVDADTTRLQELSGILKEIRSATDTKQSALNTEADINARIKALKDERSTVEINSARYRELTADINTLQNRLPKTYESIAQKKQAFNEKVIAAQRELEEAQIELIQDGVVKQERALALQHQRNLDRIRKEREELLKSKKAAGGGTSLSPEEEAVFTERTDAENKAYAREQNKLVDEEIAYKKQQYELYWRWVEHLGKEVADKQFADLLTGGRSFAEYVNKEMGKLTMNDDGTVRDSSSRSEADNNRLLAFSSQQQQIQQSKSAMDLYSDSLNLALERATNLAEKISVIADYKERLESGEFHLNADETVTARAGLDQQDADYQKELNTNLLAEYKTYEEQKLDIQKQFAALRKAAEAEGNEERLRLVNKGEQEALSALNAQMLMQTESWKNLFSDLDSLTVEEIDKLVSEIQEKMNTADLKLNPADMKAVLDRLDEAKRKILDTNPFKALGRAFNDVFNTVKKGSKESGDTVKKNWKNLADAVDGCFDFVTDAIDSCDVLGDLIGENGRATIKMIQGITTAGIAMASAIAMAEKSSVILTAISVALQAIQLIAQIFDNNAQIDELIEGHQKAIDKLENSLDRLKSSFNKTYWVYSDEERKAMDSRIASFEIVANRMRGVRGMYQSTRKREWTIDELKEYNELLSQGDMFILYEQQRKNLLKQQEELLAAIEDELKRNQPDFDQIDEWREKILQLNDQIKELEQDMIETLAGIDVKSAIDEFGDAIWDACTSGGDAVEALGEKIQDVLKNAVKEALKRRFLAKGVSDAVEYLGQAMEDSTLTDKERQRFTDMANAAGEQYRIAIEALGDWVKSVSEDGEDAMTGAARSITEETGSILAGRANAAIINQSLQIDIARQQLAYQAQLVANTALAAERLQAVDETLRRIENSGSSLLSQGIN